MIERKSQGLFLEHLIQKYKKYFFFSCTVGKDMFISENGAHTLKGKIKGSEKQQVVEEAAGRAKKVTAADGQ